MLAIENKIRLITKIGNNYDVQRTILEVFKDYADSVKPLVGELQDADLDTQCYSIFNYVLNSVRYKEDEGNNQYIKTPARTLSDGYADCKSMSVLAASLLHSLGVPCYFRFVSFDSKPIYTHVYVVVKLNNGEEIIIDPVDRLNGKPCYNYARPYTLKKDIIASC